jgi:3-hydroxyisobutyrate dehydrogenase-like beta-hydroxyacid dehydrogenase
MPRKSRKNVGLIGLGIIGSRVATGLRGAGFHVFVWNRSPKAAPNFLGSPAEVAELCDIIQLFVSDAQAMFDVLDQMSASLTSRHVIICNATVGPEATIEAARLVEEKGARFLDAPFTGSRSAAERRDLVYYIGGDDATFLRARPVLEATSKAIVRIGEIGHAATVKVVTNMIAAVSTQTLGEALAIVQKAGLDPEVLAAALEHNACRSGTMDMKLPKMVMGDYEPHFSLKHMFKDVQMGIHIANALDIEIPVTTVTAGVMYGALNKGWGDLDFSALYKTYEPATKPANGPAELPKPTVSADDLDPKELHYPETKVAAPARPLSEPAKIIQLEQAPESPKTGEPGKAEEPTKSGALPRLSSVLNAPGLMKASDQDRAFDSARRIDLPKITPPPTEAASLSKPASSPKESLAPSTIGIMAPAEFVTKAPEESPPIDRANPLSNATAADPVKTDQAGKAAATAEPTASSSDAGSDRSQSAAKPEQSGAVSTAATETSLPESGTKTDGRESSPAVTPIANRRETLPLESTNNSVDENGDPNVKPFNFVKRWFVSRPGA